MASSSTSALSAEVTWEELPEKLLLRVLEHVMLWHERKRWRGAVRGVSRRWRAVHDGACQYLRVHDGMTDEGMHALCGRLPALTYLRLDGVSSLTEDGLRAVGDLATLAVLTFWSCTNVTDAVLRELRCLSALTELHLYGTSTTQAGQNELKAALPALTIFWW
jgi:hypothetical protein